METPDVMPVQQDCPVVDIVKTHQQLDHGRLAGPGRADDGDLLSWFRVEGKIVDHDFFGIVAKMHVLEIDAAFESG